jgi:hypothetical protein
MSEPQVVIINPSPKLQFMSDPKRVSAHRNTMQMPQIQDSINMALLNYQRELFARVNDANGSAAAGLKLKGALEFVDEFLRLAEAPKPHADSPKSAQLDHKV